MEGYEGVAALRGVPPPNGGLRGMMRSGGRDWGLFFLIFRRPRALSDIEENFDTQIAQPSFGGGTPGKSAVYFYRRSIFTATLFNIARPSLGGGPPVGGQNLRRTEYEF